MNLSIRLLFEDFLDLGIVFFGEWEDEIFRRPEEMTDNIEYGL
jgi:hypothetical protein